jgi:cytidine deaminase
MVSDDELVRRATEAREHAYAPYSTFRVGAAVVGASGRVYTGCNVENASFSHTCCAERVAVFKAVSEGETAIVAVAVVTDTSPPAGPCGACRQVLHEHGADATVVLANPAGDQARTTVRALLPDGFERDVVLRQMRG